MRRDPPRARRRRRRLAGRFTVPAGDWEYKAPLNDNWDENYGLHATQGGANIPLSLGAPRTVKFYYDHDSHWVTDNVNSVIAVAPGSFQSELGCPATGSRTACARGSRTPTATASTRSRRPRCLPARTRQRSRSTRLGRELRPGRRPGRREHPVHGPRRQREGHVQLRRGDPRPDDPGRPRPRQQRRVGRSPPRLAERRLPDAGRRGRGRHRRSRCGSGRSTAT